MQSFFNIFFFYDSLPHFMRVLGESFGFDTACACEFPNLYNLILHFIIAGFILVALSKPAVKNRGVLLVLLLGILFSGMSKLVDWVQNMYTATGETIFWSNTLDAFVEGFQLIGLILILWSLFITLRTLYVRTPPTSTIN